MSLKDGASGAETDGQTEIFGIRTVSWSAKSGFLVNGEEIKLKVRIYISIPAVNSLSNPCNSS